MDCLELGQHRGERLTKLPVTTIAEYCRMQSPARGTSPGEGSLLYIEYIVLYVIGIIDLENIYLLNVLCSAKLMIAGI